MAKHDKIEVGVSTILNPVPVVMVSSAGQKSKMVEAVKYGANEFIAKPFDEDLLLSVIDKVLSEG